MAVGEQVPHDAPEELLTFAPRDDGNGLEIVDHIERRHCEIHTPEPVTPEPGSADSFAFPVDRAVEIETDRVVIPHRSPVGVRNSLGFMIDELSKGDSRTYPTDDYSLDLSVHVKMHIQFSEGFSIDVAEKSVVIELATPSKIKFGVRSNHRHPAGTITTTTDIDDMMWAASYFGSALKTTSCERSFPTLRGHPPTIQFGDEPRLDTNLVRPETGVTLELPRNYRSLFVGSPLAYYLGADIESGDEPRIRTEHGFTYPLGGRGEFEESVERVLKQVFFFDCITRTEGLFQVDLHERNIIDEMLNLDFEALYDHPLTEQLERYLTVPYDSIKHLIPEWKLCAQIEPEPKHFEAVPFVLNDLAVIKTPNGRQQAAREADASSIDRFLRSQSSRSDVASADPPELIHVEESDAMEQTWIGEGAPIGASKGMVEAFRNRLGRDPADGDIDITVVCNDTQMASETDIVDEVYGSREDLPFDVSVHKEVTADELREVLDSDIDFFHYIGHIDAEGFECVDRRLDAGDLDQTGVNAFFLNACTSYRQGMRLIEAGAIAGVVTLQDVINSGAERIGRILAKLLNNGFPLRAALDIAKTQSIMGGHYLVIGDGSFDIAQPNGAFPALCDINRIGDQWSVTYTSFLTRERAIGSIIVPFIKSQESYYIASGSIDIFRLNDKEMKNFLTIEDMPIRFEDDLIWSDEMLNNI